jgi:hypothetical protein
LLESITAVVVDRFVDQFLKRTFFIGNLDNRLKRVWRSQLQKTNRAGGHMCAAAKELL